MTELTASPSPELVSSGYAQCQAITKAHGTTYFWGAAILPVEQRQHVFALYALARLADDIVDADDDATSPTNIAATTARLDAFEDRFYQAITEGVRTDDAVMAAVRTSVSGLGLPREHFERFFGAMRQDLTVTSYRTWDDLLGYMDGSAAVIGEMMVPVLQADPSGALEPARQLGVAFQVTNFLRDIGEDLDRGRVYMPEEDLDRFGIDINARVVDESWRAFMRFQISRNRDIYVLSEPGLAMMPRSSARTVATAKVLYAQILDRIEARDYDVFNDRARVPTAVKALTALRGLASRKPATWGAS